MVSKRFFNRKPAGVRKGSLFVLALGAAGLPVAALEAALLHNAASLLANASRADPATGRLQLGPVWQGPFAPGGQPAAYPFVAQGAGLDALLAALAVLRARERCGW